MINRKTKEGKKGCIYELGNIENNKIKTRVTSYLMKAYDCA
jgi:hypothetical protein